MNIKKRKESYIEIISYEYSTTLNYCWNSLKNHIIFQYIMISVWQKQSSCWSVIIIDLTWLKSLSIMFAIAIHIINLKSFEMYTTIY